MTVMKGNSMSLSHEIEKMRKEIRTDSYSMSIGEWISLYQEGEIEIHPEFQRIYRWSSIQKSNLIESILLGIPIPPIFVSQRKDGVWDVIDGLQRLSTIFQFVGILKDEYKNLIDSLVLRRTHYLPALDGKKWEDNGSPEKALTKEQKLLIKRAKIDVTIVVRESDDIAKYELFQRLNTGGSNLTQQEVRSCILVMVNPEFHEWVLELSKYSPFQETIALSERNILEQYDQELLIRFLIFSSMDIDEYDRGLDVGEYLTEEIVKLAESSTFDKKAQEERYRAVFAALNESLGSDAFRRFSNGKFRGGFLLSPFEVIAYGLGFNSHDLPSSDEIVRKAKALYENPDYAKWSGSGVKANTRMPRLLPLGRQMFRNEH